jgi:hypothetical protein
LTQDRFSIATIVDGRGYPADQPATDDVRRALNGLSAWMPDWQNLDPRPSTETNIPLSRSRQRPASVLFGTDHGRAAWFPNRFCGRTKTTAMGCYHRNLVFASAQVEALGGFIARMNSARGNSSPETLPWDEHACWLAPVRTLSAAWAGSLDTYRSNSVKRQIDNRWRSDLERALRQAGLAPLEDGPGPGAPPAVPPGADAPPAVPSPPVPADPPAPT